MTIIMLFKGSRGKGKTLTMVKDAYKAKIKGKQVIANFKVSFADRIITNEEVLNLDKNSNIFNSCILIDEAGIFFDARSGMKAENKKFSFFIQQARKKNNDIYFCTQYANLIDLRIRQQLDYVVYPNYIDSLKVCEVIYMDATRLEDSALMGQELLPSTVKIVYDARQVFDMYDTTEVIA